MDGLLKLGQEIAELETAIEKSKLIAREEGRKETWRKMREYCEEFINNQCGHGDNHSEDCNYETCPLLEGK